MGCIKGQKHYTAEQKIKIFMDDIDKQLKAMFIDFHNQLNKLKDDFLEEKKKSESKYNTSHEVKYD